MSRDAKCGLIVGVAIVIAIAVVFFRKVPGSTAARTPNAAAAVGANNLSAVPTHTLSHPVKGKRDGNIE